MSSYQGPPSPRTPSLIPPSPNRPPLHPKTALTPRSASRRRESPKVTSKVIPGLRASSPPNDGPPSPNKAARDVRLAVNSFSGGATSPSEGRSRRRQSGGSPSARDSSPVSMGSSAGSDSVRSRRVQSTDRLSLTKSMDKSAPPKGSEPGISTRSGFLLAGKGCNALLLILGGILLGTVVITGSLDWVYSSYDLSSPLFSCPSTSELIGSKSVLDGSSCEIRFTFNSYQSFTASQASAFTLYNDRGIGSGFRCTQPATYSDCTSSNLCLVNCSSQNSCATTIGSGTCTSSGFIWGEGYAAGASSGCTQTIALSGQAYIITGGSVAASPFCSSNSLLTPGRVIVIRGLLLAAFGILITVLAALGIKAKVAPPIRTTVTSQKGLLIAKASATELRSTLEARWQTEFNIARGGGPPKSSLFETGSLGPESPTGMAAVHPAKHFASSSWKYRVRVMHAMMRKRRQSAVWAHVWQIVGSALVLVTIVFGLSALLLGVLPGTYPTGNPVVSSMQTAPPLGQSLLGPIYNGGTLDSEGYWVDAFVLGSVLMDLITIFFAAMLIRWKPLASEREKRRLAQIGSSEEASLVILVSAGTCLRGKQREKLLTAIESGLSELRFGSVFVVDQGGANAPLDDTWKFATGIDPLAVHYVYLPDTHRQLALYWLGQIWMPFLHKKGKLNRLPRQMVVVDLDRTVTPTGIDIATVNKLLVEDTDMADGVGRVVLVPTFSSTHSPTVSSWESRRLYAEFYNRMLEVAVSGSTVLTLSPSEPLAVWDRQSVDICRADPAQNALAAVKRRGKVSVSVASGTGPIPSAHSIYSLYASQSQIVPNILSYMRELLLCISSLVHGPSVALKLFIVIGPAWSLMCLVARPLVMGTLVFRDPIALAFLLAIFWLLAGLTQSMHAFAQWRGSRGSDLGTRLKQASVVTYPLYQLYLGFMELGLAVAGCTFGRMKDETDRPYLASLKELYPCPPHPEVDWFTIWRTSDATRLSVLSTALDASQIQSEDTFTSVV